MLLASGKVCYFGKVANVENYFTKMGQPTPQYVNPIEHYGGLLSPPISTFSTDINIINSLVDVITAAPKEVATFYDCSQAKTQTLKKIADISKLTGSVADFVTEALFRPMFEQSSWTQFRLLLSRCTKRYYRNYGSSWGRVLISVILGLIIGLLFKGLGNDQDGFRMRIGLSSMLGFLPMFLSASSVPQCT
jgi:hypothetical protein